MNAEMQRVHKKPVHQTPEQVWKKITEIDEDIRRLCWDIARRFGHREAEEFGAEKKVNPEDMMQSVRLSLFTTFSRMTPERFNNLHPRWIATAICNQARTTFFRQTGEHRHTTKRDALAGRAKDGGGSVRDQGFIRCVYNMKCLGPDGDPISLDEAMSGAKTYKKF